MKLIIFFLLNLYSFHAFSWGMIGHRVVGEIASRHLTKTASKEVKNLLGNESLAMSSNWPDFIRSDKSWNKSHPWHYVNVEDGQTYETATKNPNGDVVEAIERMKNEREKNKHKPKDNTIDITFVKKKNKL